MNGPEMLSDDVLVKRYVCARCWSGLMIVKDTLGEPEHVECSNRYHCDGQGYVTRNYAERRREESKGELQEVYRNYPELKPARPKLDEKQLLASMGF